MKQHVSCINEILRQPNHYSRRSLACCLVCSSCLGWEMSKLQVGEYHTVEDTSFWISFIYSATTATLSCTTSIFNRIVWKCTALKHQQVRHKLHLFFFWILPASWHIFSMHTLSLTFIFPCILSLLTEMNIGYPFMYLTTLPKVK